MVNLWIPYLFCGKNHEHRKTKPWILWLLHWQAKPETLQLDLLFTLQASYHSSQNLPHASSI